MSKYIEVKKFKNKTLINDYRNNKKTSVRKLDDEQILGIVHDILSGVDRKNLINTLVAIVESNCHDGSMKFDNETYRIEY